MNNYCSPESAGCIENIDLVSPQCRVSCTGLYADVNYYNGTRKDTYWQKFANMTENYHRYLNDYAENLIYNSSTRNLSIKALNMSWLKSHLLFSVSPKRFPPLHMVQIYFDTATYDEVERDTKVTLESQLGVIGGTMGLLTGFSLLSGVEILYFVSKFFTSLKLFRLLIVSIRNYHAKFRAYLKC